MTSIGPRFSGVTIVDSTGILSKKDVDGYNAAGQALNGVNGSISFSRLTNCGEPPDIMWRANLTDTKGTVLVKDSGDAGGADRWFGLSTRAVKHLVSRFLKQAKAENERLTREAKAGILQE